MVAASAAEWVCINHIVCICACAGASRCSAFNVEVNFCVNYRSADCPASLCGPRAFRVIDESKIVLAETRLSVALILIKSRQSDSGKEADNGHYYHNFNERECRFVERKKFRYVYKKKQPRAWRGVVVFNEILNRDHYLECMIATNTANSISVNYVECISTSIRANRSAALDVRFNFCVSNSSTSYG